jgi:beta-glucosidase
MGGHKRIALAAILCGCLLARGAAAAPAAPADWPAVRRAAAPDAALEARIAKIVAGMSLRQKVGQMTQPEIKHATPEDAAAHYLGSVLNGGGSRPSGNKRASVGDWLALAQRYHDASMSTDMAVKVPILWGTDAVHGHNNVYGATIFPHNIGLGAANDPDLARAIGAATGRAVRATGIAWVFGPTVAVARDDRWGRTYESFSEDPARVRPLAKAYVSGLQDGADPDSRVIATAKHFIGDGATDSGADQGVATVTRAEMIAIHAQGYYGALEAGAQTVMASFSSWRDAAAGIDYGKMHGSRELLAGVLKDRMGFDGFVVSDWNGIGQVPGCTPSSCAKSINAGVDMVMVPEDWKAFIDNTVEQVRRGEIPMARIDDAVTRILRVKLRAGLFGRAPSQAAQAGDPGALQARALARRAVRESLVMLKNDGGVLPLRRGRRVLVVGKNADSIANQAGGWSLTWQGTENANGDFPSGDSILAGIREAAGEGNASFSETARGVDLAGFDAVIAVVGETPYAETSGDIPLSGTLQHSRRHPEDLAVLDAVAGKGVPVVTVFVTGRAAYANDLLDRSDAFVVAWLPGTEGKGVADVLFRDTSGGIAHDFRGTLAFSWPKSACQTPLNFGDRGYDPLFALGYGLRYAAASRVGRVGDAVPAEGCAATAPVPIFRQAALSPYRLYASAAADGWRETAVGADLDATFEVPAGRAALRVSTAQVNTQQDAKRAAWTGEARLYLRSAKPASFVAHARAAGALQFDLRVFRKPAGKVTLSMGCAPACAASLDITRLVAASGIGARRTVKVPLACFAARGADLAAVDVPFSLATDGEFDAALADIRIVAGAAGNADAAACADLAGDAAAARDRPREGAYPMLESGPSSGRHRVAAPGNPR